MTTFTFKTSQSLLKTQENNEPYIVRFFITLFKPYNKVQSDGTSKKDEIKVFLSGSCISETDGDLLES